MVSTDTEILNAGGRDGLAGKSVFSIDYDFDTVLFQKRRSDFCGEGDEEELIVGYDQARLAKALGLES